MVSRMRRTFAYLAFVLACLGLGTAAATAQSCSDETSIKSSSETRPTQISFRNGSADRRRLYWIDQDGRRKFYAVIPPQNVHTQPTYVAHSWVVTDDAEKCLYVITASSAPITVEVGGVAALPPGVPASGGQQPIGQANQSETTQSSISGPTAAAPSAAPVADISPIEAFELEGYYRLTPRSVDGIVLNTEASGTISVEKVKPHWSSGQWEFVEVPGTTFVLIKNRWKNTFLLVDDDEVRAGSADDDDESAHWALDVVEGQPYVRIRNRAIESYLLNANGQVRLTSSNDDDPDGQWQFVAVLDGTPSASSSSSGTSSKSSFKKMTTKKKKKTAKKKRGGCEGGWWKGNTCRCPKGKVFDAGRCSATDHGGVNCAGSGQFYHAGACVSKCPRGTYGKNGFCVQAKGSGSAQAAPQPPPPNTAQQIQDIIQGIQNIKHKCGPTQFYSKAEGGCIEDD